MPCLTCGQLTDRGSYCAAHARGGSTRRWRRVRARVLARDRYRCQLCGAPATEVDHVVRVADGGSDHPGNLRAICGRCQRSPAA
jgi:5-methylcytosine-specific restriction protein A